jgi:hypothetical protein
MFLSAKKRLVRRWRINTFAAGDHLTFITDTHSAQRFLIDTGASKSVIPHTSSLPPSGPLLYTADDKPIATWGYRRLPVHFGCHRFHFPFLLAAVSTPIISYDFLSAHHLLVDPAHHQLLHNSTFHVIPSTAADSPSPPTTASLSLLDSFPSLLSTDLHSHKPTHGVFHTIETNTRPIATHARRLDPEKHRIAQQEFLQLEKQGIIHRSNSPWSSPLHMVPKMAVGGHVVIIAASTPPQLPTPIRFPTFMISPINSTNAQFSPPSI